MRQVVLSGRRWLLGCRVPQFARLHQSGKTKREAVANIKEIIEGYIISLEEDGLPVPEEHFEALAVAGVDARWKLC